MTNRIKNIGPERSTLCTMNFSKLPSIKNIKKMNNLKNYIEMFYYFSSDSIIFKL